MKTIKVNLSQYNLDANQLSNLASEFYAGFAPLGALAANDL